MYDAGEETVAPEATDAALTVADVVAAIKDELLRNAANELRAGGKIGHVPAWGSMVQLRIIELLEEINTTLIDVAGSWFDKQEQ
jgi:hypothetical protein